MLNHGNNVVIHLCNRPTHVCLGINGSPVLLPPESLVRAHTLPLKRAELARLESQLAQVQPASTRIMLM